MGDKLGQITTIIDNYLLEQNYYLVLENEDMKKKMERLEDQLSEKDRETQLLLETLDQLELEGIEQRNQIRFLREEFMDAMATNQDLVDRNIKLTRRLRRLLSGDDLFYANSDSDTETDVEVHRHVRRRLEFEL